MKLIYFSIFSFIIISCGYPNIDSVPDFQNIELSEDELIDLCRMSNNDKIEIDKCIKEINK